MRPSLRRIGSGLRVGTAVLALLAAAVSARAEDGPSSLRAGLSRDVAPFAITGSDGQLSGFSVDLFNAVGQRLHRPAGFSLLDRVALFSGLSDDRIDLIATPVTVTPELTRGYIFSTGYMWTEYQFGVHAGGARVGTLDDLRGHSLAVSRDTPYSAWAERNQDRYGFTTSSADSTDAAVRLVLDGKADVVLAGSASIRYAVMRQPTFIPALAIAETRTAWAAVLRRTDTELRDAVDDALDCLKQDGTVASLSRKWFGVNPGPDDLERVVAPGHGVPGVAGYTPESHPLRC